VATQAGDEPLKALCAYAIRRHYPELGGTEHPARALLAAVVARQAELVARWLSVGFVHGVMNTDNMAISGETIDYGPCAFIDFYDPGAVFSSIDANGRYAFGNQPRIAQWNLARFAEALLPLLDPSEDRALELANAAVQDFAPRFAVHSLDLMRRKLGLGDAREDDTTLIEDLLAWMQRSRADFTNTFAALASADTGPLAAVSDAEFQAWHTRWRARLALQAIPAEESTRMRRASCPAVIPRNHQVEAALESATSGNLAPIKRLLDVLSRPYDHERAPEDFRAPAPASSEPYRTFCGT
jgi:uncharacterized protein YdiU (UPF0061 family)